MLPRDLIPAALVFALSFLVLTESKAFHGFGFPRKKAVQVAL
jgi:hypothetical protein